MKLNSYPENSCTVLLVNLMILKIAYAKTNYRNVRIKSGNNKYGSYQVLF